MKNVPRGIVVLAIAASGLIGASNLARAQEDEPQPIVSRAISATVDFGNDAIFYPAKKGVDFDRLGASPGKPLTITVQFAAELSGQLVIVEPLDGGIVSGPEEGFFIAADGTVAFPFQTGPTFGAARIAVHQLDDTNFVQLWIVDPAHPENTPPDLPGVY
jgi:hypothetical protein